MECIYTQIEQQLTVCLHSYAFRIAYILHMIQKCTYVHSYIVKVFLMNCARILISYLLALLNWNS